MFPASNDFGAMLPAFEWQDIVSFISTVWPVWLFGLIVGLMCPRSLGSLTDARSYVASAVSAVLVETRSVVMRFAVTIWGLFHYFQPLRDGWTARGTFRRWRATLLSRNDNDGYGEYSALVAARESDWYITEADLEMFRNRVERDVSENADSWDSAETIVLKVVPNVLSYIAKRRRLRDIKKTEYLSTSVTAGTTPREVMDFYLSDPVRQQWDGLLTTAKVLESGRFEHREQVVHWVRSFPFAFLSDRSYVIARRLFEREGVLYGISKAIKYPGHDCGNTVRMDTFWSMWSCKQVPCPFGSGEVATETTLLHLEDFKISENLSRLAVKCGMWGFVKQMTPSMAKFVAERRGRGVDPSDVDPNAFGAEALQELPPAEAGQPSSQAGPRHRGRLAAVSRAVCAVAATGLVIALGNPGPPRSRCK